MPEAGRLNRPLVGAGTVREEAGQGSAVGRLLLPLLRPSDPGLVPGERVWAFQIVMVVGSAVKLKAPASERTRPRWRVAALRQSLIPWWPKPSTALVTTSKCSDILLRRTSPLRVFS